MNKQLTLFVFAGIAVLSLATSLIYADLFEGFVSVVVSFGFSVLLTTVGHKVFKVEDLGMIFYSSVVCIGSAMLIAYQ